MERVLRRLLIFSILFGLLAPALLAVDYLVVFDESSTVRIYDANTFQLLGSPAVGPNGLRAFGIPDPTNPTTLLKIGNSGFVVGERGFGPATALDTVDAPILKPSAFGRGWDLGACVNGGVEGRAGDAPLPPKWLITMGLRQKNRFNECKACGCEPASNHMSGFGFSATDSDSGRRAHGSHERARSARKGRKKHVSVLPRPNRSPWIVVEQNHNGIGKLMVPAFQIYANMNVINDL